MALCYDPNFLCEFFTYDFIMEKKFGGVATSPSHDIWLDIFPKSNISMDIYISMKKIDFLFKKCAFVNETMFVECKNCIF